MTDNKTAAAPAETKERKSRTPRPTLTADTHMVVKGTHALTGTASAGYLYRLGNTLAKVHADALVTFGDGTATVEG